MRSSVLRGALVFTSMTLVGCHDGPTSVTPAELTVSVDLMPGNPSRSRDTLGIVAVVGIGNPHPYPVVLRARDHQSAWSSSVRICSSSQQCSVLIQPVFRDRLVLAPFEAHYEVLRIVQPGKPLAANPGQYTVTGTLLGRRTGATELQVVP